MIDVEFISYPLVMVRWYDAETASEWGHIERDDWKLPAITTVGHLIKEGDDYIVIALSIDLDNEMCSDAITIPSGWIESFEMLSVN